MPTTNQNPIEDWLCWYCADDGWVGLDGGLDGQNPNWLITCHKCHQLIKISQNDPKMEKPVV